MKISPYFFGMKFYRGGSYDGKVFEHYYEKIPARWFWYLLWCRVPKITFGFETKETKNGIFLRYNDTFYTFFWKPVCDGWFDANKVWHKSNRFQFLHFQINQPKESPMNEEITNTAAEAQLAAPAPLTDEELKALLARTGTEVAVTADDEDEVAPLSVH